MSRSYREIEDEIDELEEYRRRLLRVLKRAAARSKHALLEKLVCKWDDVDDALRDVETEHANWTFSDYLERD